MAAESLLQFQANDLAHQPVHVLVHPAQHPAFPYGRHDTVPVNLLYDQRHGKNCRRFDHLHSLQQQGRDRRLGHIIYARTHEHRIQYTQSKFQCM